MSVKGVTISVFIIFLMLLGAPSVVTAQGKTPVDINQADLQLLQSLPGIGPVTAQRIVEYREENGRFERIEELMNVWGIGEKKFERLKELITVAQPAPESEPPGKATEKKPQG
jgi:competence protein ComEA